MTMISDDELRTIAGMKGKISGDFLSIAWNKAASLAVELLAARKVVKELRKIQSQFGRDIPLMDALAAYDAVNGG